VRVCELAIAGRRWDSGRDFSAATDEGGAVAQMVLGSGEEASPAVLIESFINAPLVTLESHLKAEQVREGT